MRADTPNYLDTYSVGDGASRVHELMEGWLSCFLPCWLHTLSINAQTSKISCKLDVIEYAVVLPFPVHVQASGAEVLSI